MNVTIEGNLGGDPQLNYSQAGKAVGTFSVAVNRRIKDADGEWQERMDGWFRVVCFGELAENVAESLGKGDRVVVAGRLHENTWETPEGDKRSQVEIQADEVGPSLRFATAEVRKTPRPDKG